MHDADRSADDRRSGTLLVAWGLAGLVLLGAIGIGAGVVAVNGIDGFDRVGAVLDEIVTVIDSTQAGLETGATTLGNVGVSLADTGAVKIGTAHV